MQGAAAAGVKPQAGSSRALALAATLHELLTARGGGRVIDLFRGLQAIDEDGDNARVSLPEWNQGLTMLIGSFDEVAAQELFQLADIDKSGNLDFEELERLITRAGNKITSSVEFKEWTDPLDDLASKALFIALPSRAWDMRSNSSKTWEASAQALAEMVEQTEGARLGAGKTNELVGWQLAEGRPFGSGSLLRAGLIHEQQPKECSTKMGWARRLAHIASMTRHGVLIMAGSAREARRWAFSTASQLEVSQVPEGRLFVLISGHICAYSEGEILSTTSDGRGHVLTPEGEVYEGQLRGGKFHGQGKSNLSDGSLYEGGYSNGLKHGRGKTTFPDGLLFVGEYALGQRHGPGRLFTPRDSAFAGPTRESHYLVCDGFWEKGRFMCA